MTPAESSICCIGGGLVGGRVVSSIVDSCLQYCFSGYVGHYVLLLSYDAQRDGFLVHDPARQTVDGTFVASLDLHVARHSHGTDEDLIVVPFQQSASLLPRLHPDASAASPAA